MSELLQVLGLCIPTGQFDKDGKSIAMRHVHCPDASVIGAEQHGRFGDILSPETEGIMSIADDKPTPIVGAPSICLPNHKMPAYDWNPVKESLASLI